MMDFYTSSCLGHTTGPAGQLLAMLMQSVMASPCNLSNSNIWPKDYGDYMNSGIYINILLCKYKTIRIDKFNLEIVLKIIFSCYYTKYLLPKKLKS